MVTIQLNPRALSIQLNHTLQRTEQLVRIGLDVPEPNLATLDVPDQNFLHFRFDTFPVWKPAAAKREFSTWVLTNGFCDIAEAISVVLEELNRAASMIRLINQFGGATTLKIPEWEKACKRAAERFNRFPLPDKLAHLGSNFGIHLPPRLEKELLSINAARNCFVHRHGVVGEKDLDGTGQLTVYYRRLSFTVGPSDAPMEVNLPYTKQDGDDLRVMEWDISKSFLLGELISFDSIDFSGCCWTAHRFGVHMEKVMLEYCKSHGIEEADQPAG